MTMDINPPLPGMSRGIESPSLRASPSALEKQNTLELSPHRPWNDDSAMFAQMMDADNKSVDLLSPMLTAFPPTNGLTESSIDITQERKQTKENLSPMGKKEKKRRSSIKKEKEKTRKKKKKKKKMKTPMTMRMNKKMWIMMI